MKRILLLAFCLFTYILSHAQDVVDTHPDAQIFVIDYRNGQEYPITSNAAILFKDSFIELVRNTIESRQSLRVSPGRKTVVIKQIDPHKLNGYQLTWQATTFGQTRAVSTFYYNIDENSLYYFDQGAQNWVGVQISEQNLYNLDDCRNYARFNSPQGLPDMSSGGLPDLSSLPDTTGEGIDEEVTTVEAPPALPEYDQPECPTDGYMWQPGYWAFSPVVRDYYWVPGVWVAPPSPDVYWTPGYWGFTGGIYRFHVGYWGHSVGFYGGINYGYGYTGVGYVGGEWRNNRFAYNTAVVHVNKVVIHNTYVNTTVINNTTIVNNRASYNGHGGVTARPTAPEQVAMREHHIMPTHDQITHQQAALGNKDQFAKDNHGRPTFTSMDKVQPAVLNKGNSPAANPGGHGIFNRQSGNNGQQNNQPSRPFDNNRQPGNNQPASNGTQNNTPNRTSPFNGHQPNTQNNNSSFPNRNNGGQPANNTPANNSTEPAKAPVNNNQPANNGQQNNGFNRGNHNPVNQQPADNNQQNNGFNHNNTDQNRQPANNNQQNNGFNYDNRNQNNQQPANNQQNNQFSHQVRTPAANQQPANNNNQQPANNNRQNNSYGGHDNRSPASVQPPANNQQNNNRVNQGNRVPTNTPKPPANEQRQNRTRPQKKDDGQ